MEFEQVINQNRERFFQESRNNSQSSGFYSSSSSSDSYEYGFDNNGYDQKITKNTKIAIFSQACNTFESSDLIRLDKGEGGNVRRSSEDSSTSLDDDDDGYAQEDDAHQESQKFHCNGIHGYGRRSSYQNYGCTPPLEIQTGTRADYDKATETIPLVTTPTYAFEADYLSCTDPTMEWYKFRCQCPIEFVNSVAKHLWFISFTHADMDKLKTGLALDDSLTTRSSGGSRVNPECDECRLSLCALMRPNSSPKKENELNHWYMVVSTMLNYLLEGSRYKLRSILLRPGNVANMNRLEKVLFPPNRRIFPVPFIVRKKKYTRKADQMHYPVLATDIINSLHQHTTYDIAGLLICILRSDGMCLIPQHIRPMFLQVLTQTDSTAGQRRVRATAVLFQCMPVRTIRRVISPLLALLTKIACEPVCETHEMTLAILFAPILFIDRHTATTAALLNPLYTNASKCLFRMAKNEMIHHQSVRSLFQIQTRFHEECIEQFMHKLVSVS